MSAQVIAISLQKGGVGKTTTAINLGAALAELGFRTLIIDIDPQGNATSGLGIQPPDDAPTTAEVFLREATLDAIVEPTAERNLFVAPAPSRQTLADVEAKMVANPFSHTLLKSALSAVVEDFDYILIDCPPTLGRLTVNAFVAADEVLAPVQCQYFALEGLRDLLNVVDDVRNADVNPKLNVSHFLITMFEKNKNLSVEVEADLRAAFGERVLKTTIPYNVKLAEAPSMGMSVLKHATSSTGAKAYRAAAKELSNARKPQAG